LVSINEQSFLLELAGFSADAFTFNLQ